MATEKERQMSVLNNLGNRAGKINTKVAVKQHRMEQEQARRWVPVIFAILCLFALFYTGNYI